jgi:hypothetical protein
MEREYTQYNVTASRSTRVENLPQVRARLAIYDVRFASRWLLKHRTLLLCCRIDFEFDHLREGGGVQTLACGEEELQDP